MKYLHLGNLSGIVQAADWQTALVVPRIPCGTCNDACGSAGSPPKFRFRQTAINARLDHIHQVRLEPDEDRLRLWIPESRVVLQHLRPLGSHHEPAIENAG